MATIPTTSVIDSAIVTVREDLDRVRQIKKCTGCECLLDVLEAIRADLTDVDSAGAQATRADFGTWWEAGNVKRHRCPGCEPCLPIAPYNQLNAALAGVGMTTTAAEGCAEGSCACGSGTCTTPSEPAHAGEEEGATIRADELPQTWPVVAGHYVVGDPAAPVAICTLADDDLKSELTAAGVTSRVAITGTLATENLGVEHAVRNLAANPRIQTLVLCGHDSRGHRAGQALLALKQSGIDAQRRIVGVLGSRAVLKNLTDAEIEAFRGRITLVDEIGTQDVDRITSLVAARLAQATQQDASAPAILAPSDVSLRRAGPKVVAARAQERREWVHDPEGFFVVLVDREAGDIVCEHYAKDGVHDETIRGLRATDVANTAVRRGLLSRLDHAAYLGRELAKAESALALNLPYTQDEPLGER
jgi:tetrahydromethanopterin S-methyltransferase subunit A